MMARSICKYGKGEVGTCIFLSLPPFLPPHFLSSSSPSVHSTSSTFPHLRSSSMKKVTLVDWGKGGQGSLSIFFSPGKKKTSTKRIKRQFSDICSSYFVPIARTRRRQNTIFIPPSSRSVFEDLLSKQRKEKSAVASIHQSFLPLLFSLGLFATKIVSIQNAKRTLSHIVLNEKKISCPEERTDFLLIILDSRQ